MSATLFCIHGFLGSAEEWTQALPARDGWSTVTSFDWLRDSRVNEVRDLDALGASINRWASETHCLSTEKRTLVGYSMGGRIALHALLAAPEFWDSAVIISSHPGLPADAEGERMARLEQDLAWARRFRTENWDSVIRAWNSQPVFSQDGEPPLRTEEPGLRERLAWALDCGSLAKQKDLRSQLARVDLPILWIAGQKDQKYLGLARECTSLNPRFQFEAVAGAGHRVPWSTGSGNLEFQETLRNWINK